MIISFFAKREPEQQEMESTQISPSPESHKTERNVWIL